MEKIILFLMLFVSALFSFDGACEGAMQYAEEMKFETIFPSSDDSGFLYLFWDRSGKPSERTITFRAIPSYYTNHNSTNTKALKKLRLQRSELQKAMDVYSKVNKICSSSHVSYRSIDYYAKQALQIIDETIESIESRKESYEERKTREEKEKAKGYEAFKKMIEN